MSKNRINQSQEAQNQEVEVRVGETLDNEFTQEVKEAEVKATYVRKSINGYYIGFPEEIDPEYWEGKIGTTYEDFLDNKWVLLSPEQLEFKAEHPSASVKEVLEMELKPAPEPLERTLADAKAEALNKILSYDRSENVNQIIVNEDIKVWFTPEERANYKNSVESAKLLGVNEVSIFIGDTLFKVPVENAEKMLAYIQLYADACFIVTQQHKLNIEALETIEEVDDYDYTVGYPEKLNFNI